MPVTELCGEQPRALAPHSHAAPVPAWWSQTPTAIIRSSYRPALLRGGLPTTDPIGTSVAGQGLKEAPRDREMRGLQPHHRAEGQVLRPPRGPGQASPRGSRLLLGQRAREAVGVSWGLGARGCPWQQVTCSQEPGFAVSS